MNVGSDSTVRLSPLAGCRMEGTSRSYSRTQSSEKEASRRDLSNPAGSAFVQAHASTVHNGLFTSFGAAKCSVGFIYVFSRFSPTTFF